MANLKFTTKKGDTGRPFKIQVYGGAKALTEVGWSAKLTVWKLNSVANKIDKKTMTLLDQTVKANYGYFEYYPLADEVDTAGAFLAEVDVTRPDGKVFQLPTDAQYETKPYFDFIVLEARA